MTDGPGSARWRPAWVEIDLGAVRHNARVLADRCAPANLCAVVKADGYGHGAVAIARAALDGGAVSLAVALVEEGEALRRAGIEAPVLLLSEPPSAAMAAALEARLTPTLYTCDGVAAAGAAAGATPVGVQVKVDTGMHRVGVDEDDLVGLVRAVNDEPGLRLDGLWTHLAVADDPGQDAFTVQQLERFEAAQKSLAAGGTSTRVVRHAANSAGTLRLPAARYDMVRCGIALYGYAPNPDLATTADLRPAMALKARVCLVRQLPAGERLSYGLRYALPTRRRVATVPLGYADGVPRRLSEVGGHVLIGGRRHPIAGTITMDQILVDCGDDFAVSVGDEVVLLGRQGSEEITAHDWARRLQTISYEIVCGIGPRVPRVTHAAQS